jgi:hypothetical protein
MKITTISKFLDYLAGLALLVVFAWYLFAKPEPQYITLSLLGVCVLKLISSILKANFYEKEYKELREENEFLTKEIKK